MPYGSKRQQSALRVLLAHMLHAHQNLTPSELAQTFYTHQGRVSNQPSDAMDDARPQDLCGTRSIPFATPTVVAVWPAPIACSRSP